MLKDQLIAFAALIPFLTAPIVAPKAPKIDPKAGKTATAVSMEPPLGNTNPKTSKADDKKPPVTSVPVKKEETKINPAVKPETKKEEVKVDPKKPEVKKEEAKVDPKKPEVKKEETKTSLPVKPEVKKEEVKVEPKKPEVKKEETKPAETTKLSAQQLGTGDLLKLAPPLLVEEVTIGAGLKLAAQERAIIHFVVADSSGRELVNSKKRGLPFTVEPKPDGTEMWDVLLKDMRVGGSRRMTLTPPQVNGGKGLSPYIPAGIQVTVTIWLLRAARGK